MIANRKNTGHKGLIGAAIVMAMLALASSTEAQSGYAVQSKWKIGGEGGWDYLVADSTAHLLYVTHGPRVEVIDTQTGKPVGAITGMKGTHGVALDGDGKLGYISDGGGNAVVVFDRHSFQTVATIPVGTNPDGLLFEPVTKTVWAFNGRSKSVSVIDTSSRKVIATVALPGKPEFPVADGLGNVFDNIEDKNQIVRLDAKDPKVTATWSVSPCESPSGLAIDPDTKRLFAVCDEKKMVVVDSKTGKLLATPAIGDGPDATAFDAKNKLAFSSNGEGTLTVIDAKVGSYKVIQTLKTMAGGRTMALDAATGKMYIVSAQMGPRPAATEANPRPRPAIVPDSFTVVVVSHE
jgi:YVTN family beta-propeller protein